MGSFLCSIQRVFYSYNHPFTAPSTPELGQLADDTQMLEDGVHQQPSRMVMIKRSSRRTMAGETQVVEVEEVVVEMMDGVRL